MERTETPKAQLAKKIVEGFVTRGITVFATDFDGTQLQCHTWHEHKVQRDNILVVDAATGVRQLKREKHGSIAGITFTKEQVEGWFADLELFKAILEECGKNNIDCYIISRQFRANVEKILDVVGISYGVSADGGDKKLIKLVYGNEGSVGKPVQIARILKTGKGEEGRILYIDDDSREYGYIKADGTINEIKRAATIKDKVVLVEDVLPSLGQTKSASKEYGMNQSRWEECLEQINPTKGGVLLKINSIGDSGRVKEVKKIFAAIKLLQDGEKKDCVDKLIGKVVNDRFTDSLEVEAGSSKPGAPPSGLGDAPTTLIVEAIHAGDLFVVQYLLKKGGIDLEQVIRSTYYDENGEVKTKQTSLSGLALALGHKEIAQAIAEGQCSLGTCYVEGTGVDKDEKEAVRWYTLAANQGYAAAQFNLGLCYEFGEGVDKDLAQAVKWYRLAANQGYAKAQYNLGVCYEFGEGVDKDLAQAVKWYRLAANQGYAKAQYNLGVCYEYGNGAEKNLEKAIESYTKAAAQQLEIAAEALGRLKEASKAPPPRSPAPPMPEPEQPQDEKPPEKEQSQTEKQRDLFIKAIDRSFDKTLAFLKIKKGENIPDSIQGAALGIMNAINQGQIATLHFPYKDEESMKKDMVEFLKTSVKLFLYSYNVELEKPSSSLAPGASPSSSAADKVAGLKSELGLSNSIESTI
jgi:TPR repeat protein